MLRIIIVLSLALHSYNQLCAEGCLKCSAQSECLIADTLNNFYILNNTAVRSTIENCSILSNYGNCFVCNTNFYLDPATQRCVAVPLANLIDNCEFYASATSCSICETNYYVDNNNCVAVQNVVPNCLYYENATTCDTCQNNYVLSIDGNNCVAAPTTGNCRYFSYLRCNECEDGYILNTNSYLDEVLVSDTEGQRLFLARFAMELQQQEAQIVQQNVCQIATTLNCVTFREYTSTCIECQEGFYLQDGDCVAYPEVPIANCVQYLNANSCVSCEEGYHLLNNTTCRQIVGDLAIENCIDYDTRANTVSCERCSANYYLNGNNCVLRVNSIANAIQNCTTIDVLADQCEICATNFQLTTDGLECLANITNCAEYEPTPSGQPLRCTACDSGFYLNSEIVNNVTTTTCLTGNVANCAVYVDNNPDACQSCENSYYLEGNVCIQHNSIVNCNLYSLTVPNTCQRCNVNNSFNFVIDTNCQNITNLIANCIEYNGGTLDNPTCSQCQDGYQLLNNQCIQIIIPNCAETNNDLCVACAENFALNFDGTACVAPFDYITDNCIENSTFEPQNTELVTAVTCNVCAENRIPFNINNHYICLTTENILEFTNGVDQIIDGCVKYGNNIECVQCDTDGVLKYLDTTTNPPSCVADCDTRPYFSYKLANDGQISQFNVCFDPVADAAVNVIDNCAIYAPDLTNAINDFICVACDDLSFAVLDPVETRYSNFDPTATLLTDYFPSPHAKFPAVTCPLRADIATMAGINTTNLIDNCAYYIEHDPNEYSCLRCEIGNSGVPNFLNMISECETTPNSNNQRWYNLDPVINNLISVYSCTGNNIPFIAYNGETAANPAFVGFPRYDTTISNGDFALINGNENNIVCRSNNAATFGLAANDYGVADNCGVAVLLANTDGVGNNVDTFGTFCAACRPGYAAADHVVFSYVKIACIEIDNCATNSTLFNGCSNCATGYILGFNTADNTIDYDTCLNVTGDATSNLVNCYAAEPNAVNANNAGSCRACQTGYHLNADNFCERFEPINCEVNTFRFSEPYDQATWDWSIWLEKYPVGCNRCLGPYLAVGIITDQNICLLSPWVTNNVDALTIDETEYIPHCQNYRADAVNLGCNQCDTGYVINGTAPGVITGTECIVNTGIPNCALANAPNVCLECESEAYGLVNNQCILGNIANCDAYNYDTNIATTAQCQSCAPNYYLITAQNICELGNVENCRELTDDDPNNCEECLDGFYIIQNIGNGVDYCYPQDTTLGCAEAIITNDVLGGRISCNTCTRNDTQLPVAIADTDNRTICLNFSVIPNCMTYNSQQALDASDFACIECADGFYLDRGRCVARTNVPEKCEVFSLIGDECLSCDNTSYLNDDRTECIDNPNGVLGCRIYTAGPICIGCDENYYLNNGACLPVVTPIANCQYYASSTICTNCNIGFVLVNAACVQAEANNCATYESVTACATCLAGNVLETANGVTNCVPRVEPGCDVLDINPPYNCLQCENGLYLAAGECLTPTAIANCVSYSGATTCEQCEPGFALTADNTACVNTGLVTNLIEDNCIDSQVLSTPICVRCRSGYYFNGTECTGACADNSTGCLACHPDMPNTCFICGSGYFQDDTGRCNALDAAIEGASIVKVASMIVALVYLVFY